MKKTALKIIVLGVIALTLAGCVDGDYSTGGGWSTWTSTTDVYQSRGSDVYQQRGGHRHSNRWRRRLPVVSSGRDEHKHRGSSRRSGLPVVSGGSHVSQHRGSDVNQRRGRELPVVSGGGSHFSQSRGSSSRGLPVVH